MLTNLKVDEEPNNKNIYECVRSRYQITFNIEYKHHGRNDTRFSSTEKNKIYYNSD